MKVAVLTTSYPRYEGDAAGTFVAGGVRALRERGVEVEVVSPASFRHFGIAYGHGVVGNLRRDPWRGLLLPAMLASFARAARRAARDADLVHAHWLGAGVVARATGKPFVLQLWGTDVELARRFRPPARTVVRAARSAICASRALAQDARELGAREVRVIPSGVDVPARVGEPADVTSLRAALERLLGDADLRRRLGEAGRERAREHFAWPAVTDATIAAYEDALAG
jgi:hypothetical protein